MNNLSIHEEKTRLLSVEDIFDVGHCKHMSDEILGRTDIEDKLKEFRKILHASPHFRCHKDLVIYKCNSNVSAIAVWKSTIMLSDGCSMAKFARMNLYYDGKKYRYAIPLNLVEKHPPLPSMSLS